MSLIKWESFNDLDQFFDNRFFPSSPKFGWDLAVDVFEEKDTVVAKMSLPGVSAHDLDISIENDMLTISGRRSEEKETKEKDYYSKEIRRGSFARTVCLPHTVDAKKAVARYADGMLSVTMPVVPGTKKSVIRVPVKASEK